MLQDNKSKLTFPDRISGIHISTILYDTKAMFQKSETMKGKGQAGISTDL